MTLNHVQERLIGELMDYAKIQYPEVGLRTITESPDNPNRVWVVIEGLDWDDDDRIMDFTEYVSDKETDILAEYGYSISLMPVPISETA